MNQMTLDLMTPEEAHKRIFSMKQPVPNSWDAGEIIAKHMREIINSNVDLRHIDELGTTPTREPYQWIMDLALWNRILHPGSTDEGYTFISPRLNSCFLSKLEVLSQGCRPDRYLRADGQEQWPRMSSGSKKPDDVKGWTLLEALMGEQMINCGSFGYGSSKIIKVLDNLLPDASVPVEDAARTMVNLLSHYGYHTGYPEPIQVNYGMKDLARLLKRACPELTTSQIVVKDTKRVPVVSYDDLWDRPEFAEIKSILDSPPHLDAAPPSKKRSP